MDTIRSMPDEDTGDPLLRNRDAVLDALLSNPAFESMDRNAGAATQYGPDSGASAAPGLTLVAPEPRSGPSAPAARKAPEGPRASERILALLNGETPQSRPTMEYSTLGAIETPGDSADSKQPESAPAAKQTNPAPAGGRVAAEKLGRDALTQLRKPKIALTVAAVLVVLLVLLLVFTSGDDTENQSSVRVITPSATAAPAAPTTPAEEVSSTIEVKDAQSHCPPGGTPAMDAFSPEPGKAWSCPRAYQVDGQVMTIDLGRTYEIDSISMVPGWDHIDSDGTDQWSKHRTVSRVSYRFNDDKENPTISTQPTLDQRTLIVTELDPPVRASKIVLTSLQSSGEPSINDIAISSITITGKK